MKTFLYSLTGLAILHILCVVAGSFMPSPLLTGLPALFTFLEPILVIVILFRLSTLATATRKAWRMGGFTFIFFTLGVAVDAVLFLQGKAISPSIADLFIMTGGVFLILTVLYLPRPDTPRLRGLRFFLDVAVTVIFLVTYVWRFAFAPQVVAQQAPFLTITIQTTYLFLNFSALSVLMVLLFWTRFSKQVMLLVLGATCFVVGNFISSLFAPYPNMSFVLPWSAVIIAMGQAVFCWGAFRTWGQLYDVSVIEPASKFARLINRAPYSSILLCYLLILAPPPKESLVGFGVIVGVVLITLVVLLRQWLQITDNEKLTDDLAKLSSNLEERVEERGKQLEDSQSRLVASEKLASLGRLTAGLAHEINTPLAAAMHSLYHAKELTQEYKTSLGNASVTKEDYKEITKELEQNLNAAQTSLERLGEFVRRMRSQTRVSSDTSTFYPSQIVRDAVAVLQPRANEMQVTLGFFEPNTVVTLHGDATRFSQVVANLLTNALDACEGKTGGFVNVRLSANDAVSENKEVRLEVHDNGVGIPEDVQPKIFEPMFTTKEVGQGTGLGLAVVYDIVHGGFGGDIAVESTPGQGSTFTVRLPVETPVAHLQ
jgi:signal transduction histidine kinase